MIYEILYDTTLAIGALLIIALFVEPWGAND